MAQAVERYRVALISDIHGNSLALRAVLQSISRLGVDQIVCLGDVATLGPAPSYVIDQLERLGCRCINGNHDEYLFDATLARLHNNCSMILEAIEWCQDVLPRHQLDFVRRFEPRLEVELSGKHRLMLFHGSPRSNVVDLLGDTDADVFDRQLGAEQSAVMAGGHTHIQMVRQHRGTLVVNPGSVGAPFEEFYRGGERRGAPKILDHAEYAIVESFGDDLSVNLKRVALDRRALARAALDCSNPMRAALAFPYQ